MFQLTVLYGKPQDPAAFDRHYQEVHAPLAQKIPGLRGFTTSKPRAINPNETVPYLVADLYFDDGAALQAAFQSAEGQAAAGDLQNFATGGATLMAGEVQVYNPVSLS